MGEASEKKRGSGIRMTETKTVVFWGRGPGRRPGRLQQVHIAQVHPWEQPQGLEGRECSWFEEVL